MTKLLINLFGSLHLIVNDEQAKGFDSDKVRALLAYLAVESDRPHRRESLAALFWPEGSEQAARTSLRRALANLRQVIGDHRANPSFLDITRQTIQFNLASDHFLDTAHFVLLIEGSNRNTATVDDLEQAAALYLGPFLEGFSLSASAGFDEWQGVTREALQRQAVDAFRRLASYYEQMEMLDQSLKYARRHVELEPWNEEGQRQLIRLLALDQQRNAALAQYNSFRLNLSSELNIEPDEETNALVERIRSGQLDWKSDRVQDNSIRGYELRERLGAGSFGVVYRAYQPAVRRDVAVKIVQPMLANHPTFIRRFDVEAQLVARLEHPHIVPLFDYWREPDGAYLVMRWLRGGSLGDALTLGPWNMAATAKLLEQIGGALNAAHKQGFIHRDIKPANILLDDEGNAYLSDFGIATLSEAVQLTGLAESISAVGELSVSPEYMSPEQALQQPLTPASDIYCLGIVLFVMLTGKHPFPNSSDQELSSKHLEESLPSVRDTRPDLPLEVDTIIQKATAKNPRQRYPDAPSLAAAFIEAAMPREVDTDEPQNQLADEILNPYKGLRPFQEADSPEFFGRSSLIERLLDRLNIPEPPEENPASGRILGVVGPSGSGKTSVVKAGLIPALRQGALHGSEKWYILQMVPGSHPFVELESALLQIAINPPSNLWPQMQESDRGFLRAIRLAQPVEGSQLLLVVDQFEELFTLCEDDQVRDRFLDGLCAAVREPQSRFRLVITLRADFYDRPLQHQKFGQLISQNTEVVLPLSDVELEQAVAGPAERAGISLEPGLVQLVSGDLRQEPGALPLLQYALTELFEQRDGQILTVAAYNEIGGVTGAIAQRAEAIFTILNPELQSVSRQLFLHLVALTERPGSSGPGVVSSRRMLQTHLDALENQLKEEKPEQQEIVIKRADGSADGVSEGRVRKIIETFGAARLLTFDSDPATRSPTVEIAHEALLQEWPRLRTWISDSREDLLQNQRLAAAASEWFEADQDPSFLLQGPRAERFTAWAESSELVLAPVESSYLSASLTKWREQQAVERVHLENERSLQRRARNLRIALIAAFLVVILGTAVTIIIIVSDLAGGIESALSSALNPEVIVETNQSTRQASLQADMVFSKPRGKGVAYNPSGNELAISGRDAVVNVHDADNGQLLFDLHGHTDQVNNIAYSLNGKKIATTSMDNTVKVWDAQTGQEMMSVDGPNAELVSPALSPDGSLLAATSYNEEYRRLTTRVWSAATGEELMTIGFGNQVGGLAFSQDGSMLAMPGSAGNVTVWDPSTGKQLFMLRDGSSAVLDLVFSPNGQQLAAGKLDGTVQVWALETLDQLITLRGHQGSVFGVDFSPDGTMLATGGQDGTVRLWQVDGGREIDAFYGHEMSVYNVSFRPDGQHLASSGIDNKTIVWDVTRQPPAMGQ